MGGTGGRLSWLLLWWAELSKTLIRLSADGWGLVPSLLVVWPEVTQHWSLPGLFGGANGGVWEGSHKEYFPELLLPVSLSLDEPQLPPASTGDPPTPAGRSGSVSYGVTAPSPGYRCTHYFVCALQEWSLCFPQSC